MTDRRGQVFKAILTTFLFPISCCFGAIRYVNINNPTPGAGTSWATAFNNLQSALAVAGTFDQIWIAQGTYKPSTPLGRSATFSIPGGTTIYGGFNGTETANTQANPALYPTILSGDIGVAGNPSDNCYHVVTYNANLWIGSFHGVTIRDGQADAGSSSIAQPDNTGGGVVFLSANSGEGSGTDFYNCTFTNNYAFYGGAMGSYGNSALQVNYGAINCLFHDNQAVYGGAIFNTIVATDYLYVFENDIFYNNTSTSGAASVFGNAVTNGTPTEYMQMENCLFYNEPAPIFTNDFSSSAFSSLQCNYNIVWTSGTPYTSAYSGGNAPIAMSGSDIDGTFPLGSNIDADPLFVNAAGYDFHVSPCSPVIDKGLSFAETTTDFGGSARMQGPAVDIGPYETLKGTAAGAPGVTTPIGICLNSTASDLSGDVTSGTGLLWYSSATGGTGSSTAPTPVTTATGTTKYYVTQTPAGSCESPRQEIDVTVNPQPANPTYTPPPSYCINDPASALSANGTGLRWYPTATGGSGSPTAPTPSTAAAGTNNYYVTQTVSGCESPRTSISVTVGSSSVAPTPNTVPQYCINAPASALSANGTSLLWYSTAAGGSGSPTAPTPSTAAAGTTAYYVTQTPAGSCESSRLEIDVTVNPPPAAPTADPQSFCENATAAPMTANGTGLLWYTAATGGAGDPNAPTPNTANVGSTTWYVSQTIGCESPRTPVTATVNASPTITIDPVNGFVCTDGTVKLQANGADSYQWSPATGLSDPAISDPVAVMRSDIQYTVTGTTGQCSSTAQVTLTLGTDCLGYYIPNAFSPNRDGTNEFFRVRTSDVPRSFNMIVFNRFGGKVFETSDIGTGWNGTIGGNLAQPGTYVYTVMLTTSAGTVIRRQGTLMLVR